MKIKGKKISSLNRETIVLPRPNGEDIVFVAAAVLDTEEFEKIVPEPKPPMIMMKGETVARPDFADDDYLKAISKRNRQQTLWLIIKSLQATPDLEWELIDLNKPETWEKIDEEFKTSGLSNIERAQIMQAVMRANSLDMQYIEKAKERFFASQAAKIAAQTSAQAVPPSI